AVGEHVFNSSGARLAHGLLNLLNDLSLSRLFSEHEAADGNDNQDQRRQGKDTIIRQGRPEPSCLVFEPFIHGLSQQLVHSLEVHNCPPLVGVPKFATAIGVPTKPELQQLMRRARDKTDESESASESCGPLL